MVWKSNVQQKGWFGPMQVVIQDSQHCIWVTQGGNLHRCAPEHCRPVNAFEAQKLPVGVASHQFHDLEEQIAQRQSNPIPGVAEIPAVTDNNQNQNPELADNENSSSISVGSLEQPDGEPVVSSSSGSNIDTQGHQPEVADGVQIPIPEGTSEDELICEGCHCVDEVIFNHTDMSNEGLLWKMEVQIGDREVHEWRESDDPAELSFVVSAAKKQRAEVKLSELS